MAIQKEILSTDILSDPVDMGSFIEGIPSSALIKGHFVNIYANYVKKLRPEVFEKYRANYPQKIIPFRNFPMKSSVQRMLKAASMAQPELPIAEAMRQLGRSIYSQVFELMLGRVIFAALGNNLTMVARYGPRAYELFEKNGTRVQQSSLQENHFIYYFNPSYTPIDSFQIGVIEGAAVHYGRKTSIKFYPGDDLYHGTLDFSWSE